MEANIGYTGIFLLVTLSRDLQDKFCKHLPLVKACMSVTSLKIAFIQTENECVSHRARTENNGAIKHTDNTFHSIPQSQTDCCVIRQDTLYPFFQAA